MSAATPLRFTSERPARLGVLVSGRGSNMAALAQACARPAYPARIAVVIANVPEAGALPIAARHGLPTRVIAHRDHPGDKAGFEAALGAALDAAEVDLVCLAGFLRVLSPGFVAARAGRIVNVHPSLLPAFKGRDPAAQAIAAGVRVAGASVHLVTAELDGGPILGQAALVVRPEDDAAGLAARILRLEHKLYPSVIAGYVSGRLRPVGGRALPLDAVTEAATGFLDG